MLIAGLLIVRLLIVMVPALAVIGVAQLGVMSGSVSAAPRSRTAWHCGRRRHGRGRYDDWRDER
jgi:hypothetical protein